MTKGYATVPAPTKMITDGTFVDFTEQVGVLDVATVIKFGSTPVETPVVSYDGAGVFTLKTDKYAIAGKTRLRISRTGASGGIADVCIASQIYNGVSWITIGISIGYSIINTNDADYFFDFAEINDFPAGTPFRQVFARSSTGVDEGNLKPFTPSAALLAAGFTPSPSAQFTLYRSK